MTSRTCTKCKETKAIDQFYRQKRNRDGYNTMCRPCVKLRVDPWLKDNHESTADKQRRYRLKFEHGISPERYGEMLAAQDGLCAICKLPSDKTLHVDHDHSCCSGRSGCGQCVRALLCQKCNHGLGLFQDLESNLLAAAEYLRSHR